MPLWDDAPNVSGPQVPLVWRAPEEPGCGAGGRWQGLAGLRDDAPSEARGADGERAGGPDGTRNTGGAASRNTGGTKSPEASRRLRASRQGSLVVDQVQPCATLAHQDAEVAVLVGDGGVGRGVLDEGGQHVGSCGDSADALADQLEDLLGVLEGGGQNVGLQVVGAQGAVDFGGDAHAVDAVVIHAVDVGGDVAGTRLGGHEALHGGVDAGGRDLHAFAHDARDRGEALTRDGELNEEVAPSRVTGSLMKRLPPISPRRARASATMPSARWETIWTCS